MEVRRTCGLGFVMVRFLVECAQDRARRPGAKYDREVRMRRDGSDLDIRLYQDSEQVRTSPQFVLTREGK